MQKRLKSSGSCALLDERFESGVVSLKLSQSFCQSIDTWEKAKAAFMNADGASKTWFTSAMVDKVPFAPLKAADLDLVILSYGNKKAVRESSEKIIADIKKAGLRPARFEELMALAIMKPSVLKQPVRLVALGSILGVSWGDLASTNMKWMTELKDSFVPYASWLAGQRVLGTSYLVSPWNESDRFACVAP